MKRVVAISDISCLGKCSLTVALPIISSCGVETAVIPTALLSTHTGGFGNNTFKDLSEEILGIAEHWKKENITSDLFYTGYLCTSYQINIVLNALKMLKNDKSQIITDPVMADNGQLYKGFSADFSEYMLKLCCYADIITPNITEAAMLTKTEYIESSYSKKYIEQLVFKLYNLTKSKIILTGVSFDNRNIGVAVFNGEDIEYVFSEKIKSSFHGTGDIFTSSFIGAYMNGRSLKSAAQIAVNFTYLSIKKTMENNTPKRYGLDFENSLPKLINYLELQ